MNSTNAFAASDDRTSSAAASDSYAANSCSREKSMYTTGAFSSSPSSGATSMELTAWARSNLCTPASVTSTGKKSLRHCSCPCTIVMAAGTFPRRAERKRDQACARLPHAYRSREISSGTTRAGSFRRAALTSSRPERPRPFSGSLRGTLRQGASGTSLPDAGGNPSFWEPRPGTAIYDVIDLQIFLNSKQIFEDGRSHQDDQRCSLPRPFSVPTSVFQMSNELGKTA